MDEEEYMLSTTDNPFNPFTHYADWYAYDASSGYHTPEFLARIVQTSDDMSDADQELAIKQGIDEIIQENVQGNYVKVVRPTSATSSTNLF